MPTSTGLLPMKTWIDWPVWTFTNFIISWTFMNFYELYFTIFELHNCANDDNRDDDVVLCSVHQAVDSGVVAVDWLNSVKAVPAAPVQVQTDRHRHTTYIHTHLHTYVRFTTRWTLSGIARVSRYQNQPGFYWSKRQWMAVASAGTYANLQLAPDR